MNFVEQGVFVPSEPARGRGLVRLFNKADLLKIAIIRFLEEEGLAGSELRGRMAAYERRCREHDFREERIVHEATGNATISFEFQSPNYLHFYRDPQQEPADGGQAEGAKVYRCDFISAGPGFPEGEGAASEEAVNALALHHGMLISVRLLHQEIIRRLKHYANSADSPEG